MKNMIENEKDTNDVYSGCIGSLLSSFLELTLTWEDTTTTTTTTTTTAAEQDDLDDSDGSSDNDDINSLEQYSINCFDAMVYAASGKKKCLHTIPRYMVDTMILDTDGLDENGNSPGFRCRHEY